MNEKKCADRTDFSDCCRRSWTNYYKMLGRDSTEGDIPIPGSSYSGNVPVNNIYSSPIVEQPRRDERGDADGPTPTPPPLFVMSKEPQESPKDNASVFAGVPLSLLSLLPLNHLILRPHFGFFELINLRSTVWSEILTGKGQRIFCASIEDASSLDDEVTGRFTINILNPVGRRILVLESPSDCCLGFTNCPRLCSCIFGSMCGDMSVSLADGTRLGTIVHDLSLCEPNYNIIDDNGEKIMTITGSTCGDCCLCSFRGCGSGDFPIKDSKGKQIGMISKKLSITIPESNFYTVSDDFGVKFSKNLDVTWKALILSSMFIIEMMYFSQSMPHHEEPVHWSHKQPVHVQSSRSPEPQKKNTPKLSSNYFSKY